MIEITKDTLMGELLAEDFGCASVLMGAGMHCVGCPSSQMESLEQACAVHGIDCDQLLVALKEYFGISDDAPQA